MPRAPRKKQTPKQKKTKKYASKRETLVISLPKAKSKRGEVREYSIAAPGPLRVAELFAGVGGFRLGLESGGKKDFHVVWSNQWEPSTKTQHASDVYIARFGSEGHTNKDIATVDPSTEIPEIDVLVGGFPCQDYSVARTLNQAAGLVGKKGVLWWQIHRILSSRVQDDRPVPFLILENVDRLLKSPASQRGRDFAVMLSSLRGLGYIVEWRVINAADYGFAQRRRRIFIVAYHSKIRDYGQKSDLASWILESGVLAKAFPVAQDAELLPEVAIDNDLEVVTKDFNRKGKHSPFGNAGIMVDGKVRTYRVAAAYDGDRKLLRDVLEPASSIPSNYFIPESELPTWKYLKGAKNEERIDKKTGFKYSYTEGALPFPDPIDRPSRTIITGEGGSGPSRFKHVVKVGNRYRRLVPVELERLTEFPDGHTQGIPDTRRAFIVGNALVVGVVKRIGKELIRFARGESTARPSKDSSKPSVAA